MVDFFNPAGRNIGGQFFGGLGAGRERRQEQQTEQLLGALPAQGAIQSSEFQQLQRINPQAAQQFVQSQGALESLIGTREETRQKAFFDDVRRSATFVRNGRPDLAFELLSNRRQMLGNMDDATTDLTDEGLELLMNGRDEEFLEAADIVGQIEQEERKIAQGLTATAGQRERADLMSDLEGATDAEGNLIPVEDMTAKQKAAAIKLRLIPGAVGSAVQTITEAGTAEDIAETEEIIAEGKEFGKLMGASRSKAIDTAFDNIQKIDANVRNLDKAIAAIDAGANTGKIESAFFPTLKAATVQLEQVQRELGLDVIGSVTFGALSQGELDLALETALPTGLQEDELRQYLVDRKAAQDKLRAYYREQMDFLDKGGTVAGFLRAKEREQGQNIEESIDDKRKRLAELKAKAGL